MARRNDLGGLHWPTCMARIILASLFTTNPFHFFNQAGQPVSHGYVSQSGSSVLHGYNNISARAWVARVDSIIVKLGGLCGTVSSTEWAEPFRYLNYEEDYVSTAYLTTYLDFVMATFFAPLTAH